MYIKEELAYIAGLFDGEGSVSFIWNASRKNGKKYGRLRAKITNTDLAVLRWVQHRFGGAICKKKPTGGKQAYDLVFSCQKARNFLQAICPYLQIKKTSVAEKVGLDKTYIKARRAASSKCTRNPGFQPEQYGLDSRCRYHFER